MANSTVTLAAILQESKRTIHYATPLMLAQVLQLSLATIDTIMAGYYSELALASVAQGAILWELCYLILIGLLSALAPLIAHAYGSDDTNRTKHLFRQGLYLALICGVLGFLLTRNISVVMQWIGVEADIIPLASEYLATIAFAIPFFALFQIPRFLCEAIGQTKVMLAISCIIIPVNTLGNYLFMYGNWGFPEMGVAGVALASAVSVLVATLCMYFYIIKAPSFKKLNLFVGVSKFDLPAQLEILKLGAPISVSLCMEVSMFASITLLMGKLGTTFAAANQIVFNYTALTFMIPLGLGMAITARVGRALGAQSYTQARTIGISGIIMGGGIMLLSAINISFFGEFIIGLYTDDRVVISLAVTLIYFAAMFQVSDGIQVCALASLKGYRDTQIPMYLTIIGYWVVGIPSGYLLGFYFDLKGIGLLIGAILGLSFTAIACTWRFHKQSKLSP